MNYKELEYKNIFDLIPKNLENYEYINRLVIVISEILYERISFVRNSNNNLKRQEFFDYLKTKIIEICDKNKIKANTITYIGCGHTSIVLKLGDYALKVSKESSDNTKFKINNLPVLIPVYLKESFKVSENEYYSLQLSPLVNTDNLTEEDVYEAYKRAREKGYIWNDPKIENIGRINNNIFIIDLEDLAYVGKTISDELLEEIAMTSYNRNTYIYEERYTKELNDIQTRKAI